MLNFRTVADIAKSLAVSERTVARMCAGGVLPAYRVGRQWRVDQAELVRWLRGNRSGAWRLPVLQPHLLRPRTTHEVEAPRRGQRGLAEGCWVMPKHGCASKVKFPGASSARASMRKMIAKGRILGACQVYQCPSCGGWHWGRIRGTKLDRGQQVVNAIDRALAADAAKRTPTATSGEKETE